VSDIHADRRPPAQPDVPLDLEAAGQQLLDEARGMAAGRAARSLTPGPHAALTQTLLALCSGRELSEHEANGPATIQLLQGTASITSDDGVLELQRGQWAPIPASRHNLRAGDDVVALLTVAPTAPRPQDT
jgi:quercetin dioxygenase-like cupin family protein